MGKGRRARRVRFVRETRADIQRYLLRRSRHGHAESSALWLGKKGRITSSGIYQMIQRRCEEAGLEPIHPHMFRHTFAHQYQGQAAPRVTSCGLQAGSRARWLTATALLRRRKLMTNFPRGGGTDCNFRMARALEVCGDKQLIRWARLQTIDPKSDERPMRVRDIGDGYILCGEPHCGTKLGEYKMDAESPSDYSLRDGFILGCDSAGKCYRLSPSAETQYDWRERANTRGQHVRSLSDLRPLSRRADPNASSGSGRVSKDGPNYSPASFERIRSKLTTVFPGERVRCKCRKVSVLPVFSTDIVEMPRSVRRSNL